MSLSMRTYHMLYVWSLETQKKKKYMRTYSYMQEDYNRVWSLVTQKIKIPVIDGKNVLKT